MNKLQLLIAMTLCTVILLNSSSCVVVPRTDNGKHKGWFKNPKNPHNPAHIKYKKPPVKGKGKYKH